MKAQNTILAMTLIALMGMLGTACSSDTSPAVAEPHTRQVAQEDGDLAKMTPEEVELWYAQFKKSDATQAVDLEYQADLCPDEWVESTINGWRGNSDGFTYFKFKATAGQTVTITVNRIDCDVDPGMTLWFGTTNTTFRVYSNNSSYATNPDLDWLTRNDDGAGNPSCSPNSCAGDPEIVWDIEESGWYTVAVYSQASSGTCAGDGDAFKIKVTGNDECSNDADGDGFDDDEDDYPESDTRAEVQIDGCDSGVDNIAVGNGAFMMDIINYCASNAGNHGEFVSCVNYYANEWKAAGLISGNQKASIGSCASTSSLP